MKLATRYDIEAPIERVFAELLNIDHWERSAMRRGMDVARTDTLAQPGPGMTWVTKFRYRNRDRSATLRIDRMEPPTRLDLSAVSALVDLTIGFELLALSVRRTRLHLAVEMKPKTLASKLYLKTLRLARSRVDREFQTRVGKFVLEIEDRITRR
jgi:hypothetical protein